MCEGLHVCQKISLMTGSSCVHCREKAHHRDALTVEPSMLKDVASFLHLSLSLAYPFSVLVWKIHILQLPAFCSGYDWLWAFRRDEHNTLFMATLIIAVSGSDRRRNVCLLLLSSVHPLTFLSIGVWSGHNTMPFQEYAKPGFWAALTLRRTFAFELCRRTRALAFSIEVLYPLVSCESF